jgi:hypothetical protein
MNQLVVFPQAFTRILGVIMYIRYQMSNEDTVISACKLRARDSRLRRPAAS